MSTTTYGSVASTASGELPDRGGKSSHTAPDVSSPGHGGGPGQVSALFRHTPPMHQPRNVNLLHKVEQAAEGTNTRIAIELTKSVGTMWTAYTFCVIAIIGLFAILGWFPPLIALLVAWASQTLIQLVLLPVIMVGQNVLGRKAELLADEQFNTTMKSYHDIEEIMQHLSAQDAELLRQSEMLIHLLQAYGSNPEKPAVLQGSAAVQSNTKAIPGAGSNVLSAATLHPLSQEGPADEQPTPTMNEAVRS